MPRTENEDATGTLSCLKRGGRLLGGLKIAAAPSCEIRLEFNGPFWYHGTAGSAQVSP